MSQHHWLEFLKYYDLTILYHPGKENIVVGALRWKSTSMGSLAHLLTQGRPLALEVHSIASQMVRLDILIAGCVLTFVEARSFLIE